MSQKCFGVEISIKSCLYFTFILTCESTLRDMITGGVSTGQTWDGTSVGTGVSGNVYNRTLQVLVYQIVLIGVKNMKPFPLTINLFC